MRKVSISPDGTRYDLPDAAADEREIKFTIHELVYTVSDLTDLNAEAETMYLDCAGIAHKTAANPLITAEILSNDSAAYDGA